MKCRRCDSDAWIRTHGGLLCSNCQYWIPETSEEWPKPSTMNEEQDRLKEIEDRLAAYTVSYIVTTHVFTHGHWRTLHTPDPIGGRDMAWLVEEVKRLRVIIEQGKGEL